MLFLAIFFVCSVCVGNVCSGASKSRLVNIEQGPIRGYKAPDEDHFVFYGIPYATAPTGTRRFQAPLPPPTWMTTFEAIDRGVICPQMVIPMFVSESKTMQEDCLIANVYVPDTEERNLPVIVHVHGGAYMWGYGDLITPRNLVNHGNVIVVNFNYRLAAHGFLCLGTKDVPGNAAMKDQVSLLRWVKKNIANFGGDPDNVSLTGFSAGASAVDLLMISKTTKGLFNKVIPESGANVAIFSIQRDPVESAKIYAKLLNFSDVNDFYALEEFYKKAPFELLTSINLFDKLDIPFLFVPCVERDTGVERFLEDDPVHILESGDYQKLPMLYGFTTMEGLIRINAFDILKNGMNEKFSDFLPGDLRFASDEEKELVAAKVKEFYFGNKPVSESVLSYIDYYSDITFTYAALRSINLQVQAGNNQIYLYEYAFEGGTSIVPTKIRGASHCAQTIAVLDELNATRSDESHLSEDYRSMKKITREIWLNFVRTGKPIPEGSSLPAWPPTGPDHYPYMVLDETFELKRSPLLRDRYLFWDEIYKQYYRYPIPPPTPPRKERTEL
ncbi:esterase FE4-like [Epargyreus clarus]|uniref:esterase FE4-like n=1 Tax=Epargyreus clarus TaxID=520877 RepID=UPI003C3061AB